MKAEVQRDSPGAVLSTRLRLPMPEPESRAGGDRDPVVCCRPDTDRLFTKEQTEEDSKLWFWSEAPPQMVSPVSVLPATTSPVWVLFHLGLRLPGCALLLCYYNPEWVLRRSGTACDAIRSKLISQFTSFTPLALLLVLNAKLLAFFTVSLLRLGRTIWLYKWTPCLLTAIKCI